MQIEITKRQLSKAHRYVGRNLIQIVAPNTWLVYPVEGNKLTHRVTRRWTRPHWYLRRKPVLDCTCQRAKDNHGLCSHETAVLLKHYARGTTTLVIR